MSDSGGILITTDSVCDLPDKMILSLPIAICPYYVKTSGGKFLDDLEISADEVLEYMEDPEKFAQSEAPSPEDYRNFFVRQKKNCREILHISMGRNSSRGYDNAVEATGKISGVSVLDSGQISSGLGLVVLYAARIAKDFESADELREEVKKYAEGISSGFIVKNLEFLNRSGRLSDGVFRICEKLLLHPLLMMKRGKISVGGVRFGKWDQVKKAYIRHELKDFERIDNSILFISHAGLSDRELDEIKEETKRYADFKDIRCVEASPAISSNCGRGTFGLLFAKEKKPKTKGKGNFLKNRFNYVILAVFAVAMALILGLNVKQFYDMIGNQSQALGRQQLTEVSGKLESTLYESEILTHKVAEGVSSLIEENSDNTGNEKLEKYLNGLKEKYGNEDCMNIYTAGEGWYIIPDFTETEGFVATERDWYKGAKKKGRGNVYITAPYQDARTGDMCFTVSELLEDEDTVVGLDFSLVSLQENVSDITIEGGDALIVNSAGQIVGYPDESLLGQTLAQALPQYTSAFRKILSSGQDSMFFKTQISGSESTVFYSCTQNEWYLLSVVSDARLYRTNLLSLILYTFLDICLMAGIILLYIIGQKYRKRAERRLFRTEQAISDIVDEMKAPMDEVVKKSDYRMFLSSDDPDEYMGELKKSSVSLRDSFGRLSFLKESEKDKGKKTTRKKRYGSSKAEDIQLSDKSKMKAAAGIVTLLAFTMILCISISTTIMKNWGNTRMEREAEGYVSELDSWVVEQKSVLDMFVSYISTNPTILDDYEACVEWLNDITVQYEDISVSYMTNPKAEHIVIMNNGWEPEEGWNMEERQWYIGSMESEKEDGFYITTPYFDSQVGAYCVTISKRVYDKNGNYLGIFGIDFFLDKLTEILASSYTDEGYAFIADSDGNIINHPDGEYQMTEERAVSLEEAGYLDAAYADETVLLKDYDGNYKAVYAVTDETTGFSIFCIKNWKVIYGSLVGYDIVFLIIFGVGITVTVMLLRMIDRRQKRAVSVLQKSADDARYAGEAKSKFLAQMSHEIRTPINAILGMNEMILRETDNEDVLEYSDNIQNAGRTLLTLINSILDFSKIEDGKMEIVPVQYDTASMVNDLVNMVRERAEKKDLLLKLEIDSNLPKSLYGDDVRIRQVITNILTNAVKYTQEGSVTLRINSAGRTAEYIILHVEVEDTGMGIRDEDRETLFESFARLDMEKNRAIEGTGLGISIVQKLLLMMDSSLQLDSVYGEGSNFYFDIRQQIVDDTPIGDYEKTLAASGEKTSEVEYVYAPDAKVLVVDDNNMNLKVAKGLLKRSAMQVETAISGREAIEKTAAGEYDILFIDHMMPQMDGVETLHEMQNKGLLDGSMPVIMMTANAISGAREEYLKEGFTDYISKPIEVRAMEKILKEYLPVEKVSLKSSKSEKTKEPSGEAKTRETLGDVKTREVQEAVDVPKTPEAANVSKTSESKEDISDGLPEEKEDGKKHIDMEVGLGYCMEDPDFYKEMLKTYVEEKDEKMRALEKYLEEGDIRNYTVQIHAVKSTSKTIGAMEFADHAYELEKAGKEERIDDIRHGHDAVMREYDEVIEEAKRMLV